MSAIINITGQICWMGKIKFLKRYNSIAKACGKWIFTNSNIQNRSSCKKTSRENEDIQRAHRKHALSTFCTINFDHLTKKNF